MSLREAAQQALVDMACMRDMVAHPDNLQFIDNAITALRTALAEPEQEPVAWRYQNSLTDTEYLVWNKGIGGRNWTPLYTHPVDDTALLRQAVESLEYFLTYSEGKRDEETALAAITALRERLGEKA